MRITFLLVALLVHSTKATETCEEECTTSCEINCPETRTCTEEEIDCGALIVVPTPPHYCDESRICVPDNCQCQTKDVNGEDCPLSCTTECAETDALCVGAIDSRGCKQADFCIARATDAEGNLCPGVCPVSCLPDQIQCSVPNDEQGCAQSPTCVAKGTDENTRMNCPGVCPTTCTDEEMHCSGGTTDGSCPVADTCVAKGVDKNGQLCPGCCPVECTENEILCQGSIMPNECPMADSCKPKAKDSNGEYCPDNSASHNCAVSCKEEETLCPGHLNQLGCKDEDVCKAMTKDRDGNFCPATSVCHVPCKVNEISCSGGMDINGCKKPDMCLPMGRDYENNLCPAHCPSECHSDDQITCSGKVNDDGCRDPDVCVERDVKRCGPDVGDPCSGICPVECGVHEIKCASQLDCNCCPTEEVCRPKAKDMNGMFCPDESASHNCPKICDERAGEVLCPVYEDSIGCKPVEVCMVKAMGHNGNYCPESSVCPKQCGNNEILCPDGEDANGCRNSDICISKGTDLDGNLCTIECPPVCNDNTDVPCKGGLKENGCKEPDFCEAKVIGSDGAQCVAICQHNPCPETGIVIPGEPDTNGCPTESTCGVPKVFGAWTNDGSCQASGEDPNCGPGTQLQTRTCVDGTIDPCTATEIERRISCEAAETQLDMCYIEKTYCMKYETGTVSNADSGSTAEVAVTLSNEPGCQILFSLNADKEKGDNKLVCKDVTCPSGKDSPQDVRIRQEGSDGWFLENMQMQTYPGSSNYITYSVDGQISQFWVDGNSDSYNGYPVCDNGKWCDLRVVG